MSFPERDWATLLVCDESLLSLQEVTIPASNNKETIQRT
jgi:hypothetical protein